MELYMQYEFILKENECIEKEQSKIRVAISNYENKKAENNIVKNELTLLDDSDIVYKLIGPILVQQETSDAKIQVDSRIEMINKEIHKLEKNYQNNFKKIDENKKKIADIQGKLIQLSKQLEQMKKEGKN
jgi:prefoldin beta subunit